jgi:hypothetical protein
MRYEVKVQRTVVKTTVVDVEAKNEESASDKATMMVEKTPDACEWELESDDLDVIEVSELDNEPDEDDED